MKRVALLFGVSFTAMLCCGCGPPEPELHNYRVEFSGTAGLKSRGYWIMYGRFNEAPTSQEFMVTVPDTLLVTSVGMKYFAARKMPGEGTLYVDIFKDGEQVLEEWTSADMDEITYQEPDPIKR